MEVDREEENKKKKKKKKRWKPAVTQNFASRPHLSFLPTLTEDQALVGKKKKSAVHAAVQCIDRSRALSWYGPVM